MIHFKTVRWRNFLSTGNQFTEIQLDRNPSTLIIGKNGSGKSSMSDALCFGLFGKPFRPINKPQLVNSINQREMEVEIEFSVSGKEIKIVRGMKPNKFEIWVDGNMVNQDAAAKDYQQHLEQNILKLNYRSFTQVVILGSSTFVPFMQLPAKARREVVEEILDIRIFSLMNVVLKTKAKMIAEELTQIEFQINLISEKIKIKQKYIDTLKENKNVDIEEKRQKIEENSSHIQSKQKELDLLSQKIHDLLNSITDESSTNKKIAKIRKTHTTLENKLKDIHKNIGFFEQNDVCPTCTQAIDSEFREKQIDEKAQKVDEIQQALNELKSLENAEEQVIQEIEKVKQDISKIEIDMATINSSIKLLKKFNTELNAEISKAEKVVHEEDEQEILKLLAELDIAKDKKNSLLEQKPYFDVAKNLLQDSGIKTKIIKKYLPVMNKMVNKYLSDMDFFVSFHLDENFNETIKSRYRDDFSYSSFSEGEKMRIDLSLLFTWRAIAKMKNSTNTNLLILDEIFDSSLDGSGTDDFLKILNSFNDQNVFVISHKQDVLVDKFRSLIEFKKEKNFSKMVA